MRGRKGSRDLNDGGRMRGQYDEKKSEKCEKK